MSGRVLALGGVAALAVAGLATRHGSRSQFTWSEEHAARQAAPIPSTWYHLTDRAKFKLDPRFAPADNALAMEDRSGRPGIYLGSDVERWVNGFGYWRPALVLVAGLGAAGIVSRRHGSSNVPRVPIDLLSNRFTPEGWIVVAGVDNKDGTEQIHLAVHVDHEDGERYFVGEISISELPAADESDCRGLKRLARSNPRIPTWHVNIVQLEPAFIGHGLGVSLYLLAAQAAVQWTRGPVILARDECRPGGETSEAADHAWRRLALRPEVAKEGRPQTWSANAEAVLVTPASLGIPVTSRLQDALRHWKGETSTMRLHMDDERAKEPMPGSRNGRERRLEAAALLFELEHYARPCPKPLYRGSMHTPRGANSWTTSRRVAEGFARGENTRRVARGLPPSSVVHELPAGTRGLRIADTIREPDGESEWIVQTPAGSLAVAR